MNPLERRARFRGHSRRIRDMFFQGLRFITRPFLRPIRRVVPLVGNVDLSPLVLIIAIQILLIPLGQLHRLAGMF